MSTPNLDNLDMAAVARRIVAAARLAAEMHEHAEDAPAERRGWDVAVGGADRRGVETPRGTSNGHRLRTGGAA